MKRLFTVLVILLMVLQSCTSQSKTEEVSGHLEGGLRYINLDDGLNVTVYRGDYIVLQSSKNNVTISIPSMEIEGTLPLDIGGKEYIKMKKSEAIDFMLGGKKGSITVKDLQGANYSEISSKEASDIIKNIHPVIIDVRTEPEYDSGHINDAILLPVQELARRMEELEKYKDEPVFLYCRSGNRSTVAAKMLMDAGFTHIYNLRRGFSEWASEGFPYTK